MNLALFGAILVAVGLFASTLPEAAKRALFHPSRIASNLPLDAMAAWVAGWFTLLFVKAEDLPVDAPVDVQGVTRFIAWLAILGSAVVGGLIYVCCS